MKYSAGERFFSAAAGTVPRRIGLGVIGGFAVSGAVGLAVSGVTLQAKEAKLDCNKLRKDIVGILDEDNYDDGSIGPVLVRLAWHSSGASLQSWCNIVCVYSAELLVDTFFPSKDFLAIGLSRLHFWEAKG